MVESIDHWAPKVAFWIKIHDFWSPFWHRLFHFFRKGRKCEISEEYNAKRGSEASKTFDFRIVFSLFSCFCSNPLLELIFRGGLRRSIHKSVFFIGFWTPAGSQNVCFELHFRQSGVKKRSTPNGPERPGADLGAIWHRKRPKDALS